MSRAIGNLTARSRQGKIHAVNPELASQLLSDNTDNNNDNKNNNNNINNNSNRSSRNSNINNHGTETPRAAVRSDGTEVKQGANTPRAPDSNPNLNASERGVSRSTTEPPDTGRASTLGTGRKSSVKQVAFDLGPEGYSRTADLNSEGKPHPGRHDPSSQRRGGDSHDLDTEGNPQTGHHNRQRRGGDPQPRAPDGSVASMSDDEARADGGIQQAAGSGENNVSGTSDNNNNNNNSSNNAGHVPGASVNWDSDDFTPGGGEAGDGLSATELAEDDVGLSEIPESGRGTVTSSTSELGRLRSPSHKSLNAGEGRSPSHKSLNAGEGETPPPSTPVPAIESARSRPESTKRDGETGETGEPTRA
ncbi:hypothetical protein EGW08_018537, partial [Elysia chlorotica]